MDLPYIYWRMDNWLVLILHGSLWSLLCVQQLGLFMRIYYLLCQSKYPVICNKWSPDALNFTWNLKTIFMQMHFMLVPITNACCLILHHFAFRIVFFRHIQFFSYVFLTMVCYFIYAFIFSIHFLLAKHTKASCIFFSIIPVKNEYTFWLFSYLSLDGSVFTSTDYQECSGESKSLTKFPDSLTWTGTMESHWWYSQEYMFWVKLSCPKSTSDSSC